MCRIALLLFLMACALSGVTCTDESPPRLRLDPELRRALLRALTQLELEAQRKAGIANPTLQAPFDDQPVDEEQEANIKRDLEALLGNYENFQPTQGPEEVNIRTAPAIEDSTFNFQTSAEELTTLNKEENQEIGTFNSQPPEDDVTTVAKDDEDQNFTVFNIQAPPEDSTTLTDNRDQDTSFHNIQSPNEEAGSSSTNDDHNFNVFNFPSPTKVTTVPGDDDQNFDIIHFHTPLKELTKDHETNVNGFGENNTTESNNDQNFDVINFHGSSKDSIALNNEKEDKFEFKNVQSPSKELTINIRNEKLNDIQNYAKDITITKSETSTFTNDKKKFDGTNDTSERQNGDDLQRQETGSLLDNQEGSAIFFKDDTKTENDIQSNIIPSDRDEDKKKDDKKKQDQHEVSIFEAPLVAAFTLEQDEKGNPKSVVPLLRPLSPPQASQPNTSSLNKSNIQHQDTTVSPQQSSLQTGPIPGTQNNVFQNNLSSQNQQNTFQTSSPTPNQQSLFQPSSFSSNNQNTFKPDLSNQQNNFQRAIPEQNNFRPSLNQQNNFQPSASFLNVQNNGNLQQNPSSVNQQNNFQSIPNQQNNFQQVSPPNQQNSFLQVPPLSNQQSAFQQNPSVVNKQNNFQVTPSTNQQNNFQLNPSIQQSSPQTSQQNLFQRNPPFTNQQTNFQPSSHTNQPTTFQQIPPLTNQQTTFQTDPFPVDESGLIPPPLNQDHIFQPAASQVNPQQISHSVTVQQSVEPSQQDLLARERELEHRTRLLEQQLLQLREQQHLRHQQQLQFQQQQILKQQQLLLQEQQRVKQQRQLEERQRFQEPPVGHRTQRQETGTGIVDFQRSIGIQFGQQTIHQPLQSIQNLLFQSGIAGDLQSNVRNGASPNEDLSLVSRILALNHEGKNESVKSQTSNSQKANQEDLRVVNKVLSLNHIDKVQQPSRFITPPFV